MTWKKIASALLLICCAALAVLLIVAYKDGKFDSVETLQEDIAGFGMLGPLVLTALQMIKVIVPVLPELFGCAAGAMLFGCVGGFLCNFVGLILGSVIAFFLARKYGAGLVRSLFPEKTYKKWADRVARSKSYSTILFLGMLLPVFPDDYFCYITGLTEMRFRKFLLIILLGKPWCILVYSILFSRIT